MPRVAFTCTGSGVKSLYVDGVDYTRFVPDGASLNIVRNSVINPVPGEHLFVIDWLRPELIKLFGSRTEFDDDGRPFRSHGSAVKQEVKMLTRMLTAGHT